MPQGYSNKTGLPLGQGNHKKRTAAHRNPAYRWLWSRLRSVAKSLNKPFDLTFEQFLGFIYEGQCRYCSQKLVWQPYYLRAGSKAYFLDRVDNAKGYSGENCVTCCTVCNKTRSNIFTSDEMLEIGPVIRLVLEKRK
jgi:hypothetical protein